MDRILPMPDGRKAKHTWGTVEVAQRFVDNGIEMPDTSFWGGNILKGDDGLYHMYVCGWPEDSPHILAATPGSWPCSPLPTFWSSGTSRSIP